MNKNTNVVRAASWLSVQRNMPRLALHSDVLVLISDSIAKSVSLKHLKLAYTKIIGVRTAAKS
jgi:hypothetical protein